MDVFGMGSFWQKLHLCVGALSLWRARGLAFVLGFVAVFAMPPLYQIYLLVPAFSGFLWLVSGASSRWRAFVIGWWFGAGFFTAGLYWVSAALLVDAAKFAWLVPFTVFGFAFGLGLYSAVAALVVRAVPGDLAARGLVLAAAWVFLEWVRGWLFTGFPWNPLGSVWAFSDSLMQGASVVGVFGMSLLAALLATLPGALVEPGAEGRRVARMLNIGLIAVAVAVWFGGQHRLSTASDQTVPNVRLRLVQPNISQALKWLPRLRASHMNDQITLATAPPKAGDAKPTHVIWAETAAPFFIANHAPWLKLVGAATPPGGLTILGAPRVLSSSSGSGERLKIANSLLAIDGTGRVTQHFDKFHLVPFGEYVPLKKWLPLKRITQGLGAFVPGLGPVTLNLKGLPPVSPLICYEIIFPGQVTDHQGRAQWILNLTNDAWYGHTAGPYQHFVNARLRAVEEGLPVVRVAGTGISGIIDAYGRVRQSLDLGKKGFVDGGLPLPTKHLSLYSRYGNAVPLTLIIGVAFAGLALVLRGAARGRL